MLIPELFNALVAHGRKLRQGTSHADANDDAGGVPCTEDLSFDTLVLKNGEAGEVPSVESFLTPQSCAPVKLRDQQQSRLQEELDRIVNACAAAKEKAQQRAAEKEAARVAKKAKKAAEEEAAQAAAEAEEAKKMAAATAAQQAAAKKKFLEKQAAVVEKLNKERFQDVKRCLARCKVHCNCKRLVPLVEHTEKCRIRSAYTGYPLCPGHDLGVGFDDLEWFLARGGQGIFFQSRGASQNPLPACLPHVSRTSEGTIWLRGSKSSFHKALLEETWRGSFPPSPPRPQSTPTPKGEPWKALCQSGEKKSKPKVNLAALAAGVDQDGSAAQKLRKVLLGIG